MKKMTLLLLAPALLAGCASQPVVMYRPEPPVQTIPLENEANVRLPSKTKAYAVNRYVDPSNPRVMHERHVLYRVEEDARWRLRTSADRQILVGNTVTDSKQNFEPNKLEQEMGEELKTQKAVTKKLADNTDKIVKGINSISRTSEANARATEDLARRVEKLEEGQKARSQAPAQPAVPAAQEDGKKKKEEEPKKSSKKDPSQLEDE